MAISLSRRACLLLTLASGAGACSGLVAGPENKAVTPVPASRDSAYVRARRALQAESFTMDRVDSAKGILTGTRWPSASARQGTSAACHVTLALRVDGNSNSSEVTSTSRWVAPGGMSDKAPTVCDQERSAVLDRTAQVLAPTPTP